VSLVSRFRTILHRWVVQPGMTTLHRRFFGMDIGKGVRISLRARIDKTHPEGIHIGDYTAVASGAIILTHDFVNREWKDTRIGSHCFLGFNSVVLPGVTVGDHCIVAVNSVVARNVPDHSVVMGNPAKIIEQGIVTGPWGIRLDKGNAAPVAP
jgi:acetyltransferase-like isoleucine patch superfamily enzyme